MAYNPGIAYRGDQYLYQGITGAADALSQGIKRVRDERKAAKETDATFDAMGGMIQGMVKAGQLPPEVLQRYAQVQNADAETKRGVLHGLGQGVQLLMEAQRQQLAQRQAETAAGYLDIQKEQAARQQAAQGRQAQFGQLLQQYIGAGGYDVPMDPTDAVRRAAAESGTATPENMSDLERATRTGRGGGSPDSWQPQVIDLQTANGTEQYVVNPKTGQMMAVQKPEAQIVEDPNTGQVIGYSVPTGKGTSRFVEHKGAYPKPGTKFVDPETGREHPEFVWGPKGTVLKRDAAAVAASALLPQAPAATTTPEAKPRRRFRADGTPIE